MEIISAWSQEELVGPPQHKVYTNMGHESGAAGSPQTRPSQSLDIFLLFAEITEMYAQC